MNFDKPPNYTSNEIYYHNNIRQWKPASDYNVDRDGRQDVTTIKGDTKLKDCAQLSDK
jgi:hypothetical protein